MKFVVLILSIATLITDNYLLSIIDMRNQTKKTLALWLHRLAWFYICGVIPTGIILLILETIKFDFWRLFVAGLAISGLILKIIKYPVVLSSTKCYCDNFFVDRVLRGNRRQRFFYIT